MQKLKYIFYFLTLSVLIYSCGDSGEEIIEFDHEAQAIIDNDSIVEFLKNNYYNSDTKTIDSLLTGETSLFNDVNLITKEVNQFDIDYKLYVYVINPGGHSNPNLDKGNPTVMDSVFTKYNGRIIESPNSLGDTFEENTFWFVLSSVIPGWRYAFPEFKPGELVDAPNDPISYIDYGEGFIIIPSGLAYRNNSSARIGPNSNLLFYINLWDILPDTDFDNDNVPGILEDPDGDGDPYNDDTDEDGLANYRDFDDDGDGIPTREEDANGDGDPTNDKNDPNNPDLPDYLNRKVR